MGSKKSDKLSYSLYAEEWKHFQPPTKPSASTLKIYEEAIAKIADRDNPQVLILGATPELRELCFKYGVKVTIADISLFMINAMNELIDFKEDREIIINVDWLDLDKYLKPNTFDLCLTDNGFSHLEWAEFAQMFSIIKRLLKPDGYFCSNVMTHIEIKDSALELWNKFKESGSKNLWQDVFMDLIRTTYDPKTKRWDCPKLMQEIRSLHDFGEITDEDFKQFAPALNSETKLTEPSKEEFEEVLSENFEIVWVKTPPESYWKSYYLYLARLK